MIGRADSLRSAHWHSPIGSAHAGPFLSYECEASPAAIERLTYGHPAMSLTLPRPTLSRANLILGLFWFWPLTFLQAHPWSSAILVDEFDTSRFQCAANCHVICSRHRSLTFSEFGSTY